MAEKNTFYEPEAHVSATIKCKDGDIKINKPMLSERTHKFDIVTKADVINIPEFDVATFQAFLDVLMGFETLTRDTSFMIFPLVMHYDFQELIEECISNLKPKAMNKNVILSLNLAFSSDCEELVDTILNFLKLYGIDKLFLDEKYCLLLEPKPFSVLLRMAVSKSSFILQSVFKWGKNYLEKHNLDVDLRTFLKRHHILSKISIDWLDSADSVLQLYDLNSRMNIFTENEILSHLKQTLQKNIVPHKWEDVNVFPSDARSITESFRFKPQLWVIDSYLTVNVQFHPAVRSQLKPRTREFIKITISANFNDPDQKNRTCGKKSEATYKSFLTESSITPKSEISLTLSKPTDAYKVCSDLSITYTFYESCKILKTKPIFPDILGLFDMNSTYFTCSIAFS